MPLAGNILYQWVIIFPQLYLPSSILIQQTCVFRIHAVMEVNGRPSPVLPPIYFYIVLMCWSIDKLTWLTSIRLFLRVLICETDGHSSCSCWQTWGEFSLFNGTFWSLGCGSLKESFPAEGWWQDDCQHLESDQTLLITDYRLLFLLLFYFHIYFCRHVII